MPKSNKMPESWEPLKEEYIPYPSFQKHIIGLPPKERIIDWRDDLIDAKIISEYARNMPIEVYIVFNTYKKQNVLRIISGRYVGRILIDETQTNPQIWETVH